MKKLLVLLSLLVSFTTFAQLPNTLTPSDKVFGLSKFWQEVNYNFAYLDQVDREKWNNAYKALIDKVQQTENDYQYYRELQKFCALLKDGHTNVFLPQGEAYEMMNTMFGEYRLFIENIAGKAIIVRTNLSKKNDIPFGSEIIEVNGKSTEEYIQQEVSPYISSSTDHILQDISIQTLLMGFEGDQYQVKIKKPTGEVATLNLTHALTQEEAVYPSYDEGRTLLDFRWIKDKVAYVALNSFEDPKIDTLFTDLLPELYEATSLIIDLRYNGGGDSKIGEEILQYLVDKNLLSGGKSITRNHIATFKAWGALVSAEDTLTGIPQYGFSKEEAKKYYLCYQDEYTLEIENSSDTINQSIRKLIVPTAILIGHSTASAAEDFLIMADGQSHMTKIGTNTFGSTGQPLLFDLPGGGSARVCTKKVTYPDGREFVGVGIEPDIEVTMKLSDYLEKKDPILNKALEHFKTTANTR